MRTIAVIPARFRSKRLPGKPLEKIHGKTMLERVYERASSSRLTDEVLVATDDERIRDAVVAFGGRVVMTSENHPSGSDRIAEAVADLDFDLVVNVQGDEPLLDPQAIDDAVEVAKHHSAAITTLSREMSERERIVDPNVVKVVTDLAGFALYFSRSPIPALLADDETLAPRMYFEHVGLYVYPKPLLLKLTKTPPSPLEARERLEQLRALENNIRIRVVETKYESFSVDTPSDLARIREILAEASSTISSKL